MKKFLVALAMCSSVPAMAAHDLPPGDFASPITALPAGSIGTKLADSGIQAINASGGGIILNAELRAAVYRNDTTGFLDFVYQVTNLSSSNTSVVSLTFADFGNFAISDMWQTLTGFDTFTNGVEEADSARRIEAATVGIDFFGNVRPDVDAGPSSLLNAGETSAIFVVRTNAYDFKPGTFTVQDGLTIRGAGFAPAVPEPATWAMMIGGFGLMGAAARRSARVKSVLA